MRGKTAGEAIFFQQTPYYDTDCIDRKGKMWYYVAKCKLMRCKAAVVEGTVCSFIPIGLPEIQVKPEGLNWVRTVGFDR